MPGPIYLANPAIRFHQQMYCLHGRATVIHSCMEYHNYALIATATDYDAWRPRSDTVTATGVFKTLKANTDTPRLVATTSVGRATCCRLKKQDPEDRKKLAYVLPEDFAELQRLSIIRCNHVMPRPYNRAVNGYYPTLALYQGEPRGPPGPDVHSRADNDTCTPKVIGVFFVSVLKHGTVRVHQLKTWHQHGRRFNSRPWISEPLVWVKMAFRLSRTCSFPKYWIWGEDVRTEVTDLPQLSGGTGRLEGGIIITSLYAWLVTVDVWAAAKRPCEYPP
ncbi:hypothetical protein F5146DRAFT_1121848 [Armillaria mellea]|nr:hypothetical protein F5146DRAFT_1121848 [Armillaria mellea]